MSLITSCPACGTMFRVVPDQLKISEGWVRCGHCSEVFDASAHLQDEDALQQIATLDSAPPATAQPEGAAEAATAEIPGAAPPVEVEPESGRTAEDPRASEDADLD